MPHPNLSKHEPRARLRALVASGRTVAVPGATDALSAKLIEAHGFEAVYIGSYATAASRFGLPDTGLLALCDLAEQARTIANAVPGYRGSVRAFEDFMGYREFAERARRHRT